LNALNELTKSVGDTMTGIGTAFAIFSWFMPGGAIVKGLKIVGGLLGVLGGQLIKGYGELQKLGAEQNDALFKAYNRLSASGLGAAKGLEGVIDTVHTLNISVPEIVLISRPATYALPLDTLNNNVGSSTDPVGVIVNGLTM
jgi:hypothetical protein